MTSDIHSNADAPVWLFQTENNDDLRKEGLAGDSVWWMVRDGVLELRGGKSAVRHDGDGVVKFQDDTGGTMRIDAAQVARMRVGYQSRKGLCYITQVWRKGAAQPLTVPPTRDDWTAYTPAMREFAAQVARHGGLECIETGRSRLSALATPNLLYFLPLGYLWMFLSDLIAMGPAAAVVLPVYAFLLRFRNPHWPRRIRNLAELEDHLPFVPAGNTANIYLAGRPFRVNNNDSLRAHGLAGDWVWVMPRDGALDLYGDKGSEVRDGATQLHADGGTLCNTAAEVASLRVGYTEDRYGRHYETTVMRVGVKEPLVLEAPHAADSGYTQTIQGFAAAVVKQHGMRHVIVGGTVSGALVLPVLLGALSLAAAGVALFALTREPWWGRMILVAIPSSIFAFVAWYSVKRQWPRPIRDLADLDYHLPPLPR
jgi:hypothetical protein